MGPAEPGRAEAAAGVRIRGLERAFGEVRAVAGVDLEVCPGRIVGLLGPNGAGKTTTLRILSTLLARDAGDVLVAGFDPATHPLEVRRRVGYLTGETALYERLDPREQLDYFGQLFGMPAAARRARAEALIGTFGIADFAKRRCGALSTGQRQRVSIARALMHDPAVLIFDEPTSGLDVLAAQFVLKALLAERARGKAVLFCSHVMAEAELVCDEVSLIHRGRIVEAGPVQGVLARTGTTHLTAALLAAVGAADADAAASIAAVLGDDVGSPPGGAAAP